MVGSVSSGNSALRLQQMLQAAEKNAGATGKAGGQAPKIDANQAEQLVTEFLKLPAQEKVKARGQLTELFKNDQFQLDDGARTKFAHALGVDKKEITPESTARVGGTTPTKTIREMTNDLLTGATKIDGAFMKNFLKGAKEFAPKDMQQFLAAAMNKASKEGDIKMDGAARKDFVKNMGKLNQDGGVSEYKEVFDAPKSEASSALAKAMAGAQTFEQLVAAFMMHICGDVQQKTMDKMKEMDAAHSRERTNNIKGQANQMANNLGMESASMVPPEHRDAFADKLAMTMGQKTEDIRPTLDQLWQNTDSIMSKQAGGAEGTQNTGATFKAANDFATQVGFAGVAGVPPEERAHFGKAVEKATGGAVKAADVDKMAQPIWDNLDQKAGVDKGAADTGAPNKSAPDAGAPKNVPVGPAAFKNYVSKTKNTLQAAVNSTHSHFKDVETEGPHQGKTGIISEAEATKIASKLENLQPPASEVIANSMMNGLLNSSVDLDGPAKPIADWAAKQLGGWDNVDLDQVMSGHPISKGSGKLEQDIAGFIVGALEESGKTMGLTENSKPQDIQGGIDSLKDKMSVLKSFAQQMEQNPVAQQAFEKLKAGPMDAATGEIKQDPKLVEAAAAGGAGAPPKTPTDTGATQAAGDAQGPQAAGDAAKANQAKANDSMGQRIDQVDGGKPIVEKSTMVLMEELKQLQQDLMTTLQALSNILNTMKENAMNAIRNIR